MRPIRIASRPSKLAMAQTHMMKAALETLSPGLEVSVVSISTTGDRDRSDFLYKSQVQGLFTSEVENALLDKRADIAVHSLKDLPTSGAPELFVVAMPPRESAADVLVAGDTVTSLDALLAGTTVGTSSLRRIAQLKRARPDLDCVPLRGNVETRIGKVTSGEVGAAVMAHAGINRLGLSEHISAVLPMESFLPAPAQGVLAVQARKDDEEVVALVAQLDDPAARSAALAEREVLAAMHGGCSIPLGVYAQIEGEILHLDAMIADLDGSTYIRRSLSAPLAETTACAQHLACDLLAAGGKKILDQIRNGDDLGKE
ncbi:hydroxymethylbilane synthase [Planctomycetota bacterium]